MTMMIKERGPEGVVRPFNPSFQSQGTPTDLNPEQRQTEALEHIAVSLSAIDHNLELLAKAVISIATSLHKQT